MCKTTSRQRNSSATSLRGDREDGVAAGDKAAQASSACAGSGQHFQKQNRRRRRVGRGIDDDDESADDDDRDDDDEEDEESELRALRLALLCAFFSVIVRNKATGETAASTLLDSTNLDTAARYADAPQDEQAACRRGIADHVAADRGWRPEDTEVRW